MGWIFALVVVSATATLTHMERFPGIDEVCPLHHCQDGVLTCVSGLGVLLPETIYQDWISRPGLDGLGASRICPQLISLFLVLLFNAVVTRKGRTL